MNEYQEQKISPERLKGEGVANLVKQVFEKYLFEITQHLVDSNVVLTLAGQKGQTEFFIDVPDAAKDKMLMEGIKDLNDALHALDPDLAMRIQAEPFKAASDQIRTFGVNVVNFSTLAEWISKTKLYDLPPLDKSLGFEGYDKWGEEVMKKFGGDRDMEETVIGVIKGYPDQAIVDFIDWYNTGQQKEIQDAQILHTGIYKEAEPIYSFYPQHANDPEIVDNVNKSSEVLVGFYQSQWHKEVAPRLSFRLEHNAKSD